MKRTKRIAFILVIALALTSFVTPFSYAKENTAAALTREQFFVVLAKWLKLEPTAYSDRQFPDIALADPQNIPYLNALFNSRYVLGRTNGLLDPKTIITERETELVFERIRKLLEKEPEIITKIEYTDGGTSYVEVPVPVSVPVPVEVPVPVTVPVPVEVPVEVPVPVNVPVPTRMHGYIFDDARGFYYCPHCDDIKPPGTGVYKASNTTSAAITTTAGLSFSDSDVIIDVLDARVGEYSMLYPPTPISLYEYCYIGFDAAVYVINPAGDPEQISFIDMINDYAETLLAAVYYEIADPSVTGGADDPVMISLIVIDP